MGICLVSDCVWRVINELIGTMKRIKIAVLFTDLPADMLQKWKFEYLQLLNNNCWERSCDACKIKTSRRAANRTSCTTTTCVFYLEALRRYKLLHSWITDFFFFFFVTTAWYLSLSPASICAVNILHHYFKCKEKSATERRYFYLIFPHEAVTFCRYEQFSLLQLPEHIWLSTL